MTKPSYEELEQRVEELQDEIRERLRVKEGLGNHERSARAIIDHAVQFIGALSTDGIVVDYNQTALRFKGLKASEVAGKPFWETPWWTHSPELQEKLRNGIRAAAKGEFVRFETTHVGVDGKVICGDFTINPVKDETGKVIFLVVEERDVTGQRKAEQALRQSKNIAQALLDATIEAAVLTDSNGTMLAVNDVVARRFHGHKHGIIGKNVFDLLPKGLAASRKLKFMEAIQGAKSLRFEDEHKGKFYAHSV